MELLLGAMIVALWVKTVPGVIADAVTTLRASKAGQWDTINKERERKDKRSAGRREAMSKAWQGVRSARNKKAGGTGQYRPGLWAYVGDVYHGKVEDELEKRQVKRANRPPIGPDGKRPVAARLDDAFQAKVGKQRQQTGYMGRAKQVGRMLWEPVGENRTSATQPVREPVSEPEPEWLTPDPDEVPWSSVVRDDQHPYCVTPCGPNCTAGTAHSPQEREEKLRNLQDTASRKLAEVDPEMWRRTHAPGTPMPAAPTRTPAGVRDARVKVVCDGCGCEFYTGALQPAPGHTGEFCGYCRNERVPRNDGKWNVFQCQKCKEPIRRVRGDRVPKCGCPERTDYDPYGTAPERHPAVDSTSTESSNTSNGGNAMSTHTHEVSTNEDARQAFTALAAAAAEASDAVNMLEAAKAKMAAIAAGTVDGMTAKAFDATATAAAVEASDAINVGTLADWSEKIDSVTTVAEQGVRSLDKYLDSENIVIENNIDPTTMAATSS
ncbi:hypothetical protein AB0J14_04885 [Micromonospora arborensis]|uniref:hypothetical protein n=1 Tax=Micromonospora arborensis TaxID=2116518 RepID=UPI0034021A94